MAPGLADWGGLTRYSSRPWGLFRGHAACAPGGVADGQRGGGGMGKDPCGLMRKLLFGSKNAMFHLFLKVLQNRACVPAMNKSPKGDLLHNNHHDNVI